MMYTQYSGYIFITVFKKYSYLADLNTCTTKEYKVCVLKFIEVLPLLGKNRNKEKFFFFTLLSFCLIHVIIIKKLFISNRLLKLFFFLIFYLLFGCLSCLSLLHLRQRRCHYYWNSCYNACKCICVNLKNLVPFFCSHIRICRNMQHTKLKCYSGVIFLQQNFRDA